jgi:HlyD family secretion protein
MIKKNLFIIFFGLIVIVLLLFSLVFRETNTAIVAQVEPMKKAVSYHKAVKIIEIYVIAGQTVKPGDILVKVERPDLLLDVEKKNNEIERLDLDRALVDSKYAVKKMQRSTEKESDLRKINSEIEQLEVIVANNKLLSNKFGSLTGMVDTSRQQGASYYDIQFKVLNNENELIQKQYELDMRSAQQIYNEEVKVYEIVTGQLKQELNVLLLEEQQLIKRAEITGTIGSVNAQNGELLSPYTTILSIYESNPTIIKAVMNEGYKYEIEVGKMVQVESTNRKYSIEGKILEVGARIIEYPSRLKSNQNIPMWGQELFIKIPEDNKFLNGERVFVIIKK